MNCNCNIPAVTSTKLFLSWIIVEYWQNVLPGEINTRNSNLQSELTSFELTVLLGSKVVGPTVQILLNDIARMYIENISDSLCSKHFTMRSRAWDSEFTVVNIQRVPWMSAHVVDVMVLCLPFPATFCYIVIEYGRIQCARLFKHALSFTIYTFV